MKTESPLRAIFAASGGITLQLPGYARHYSDPADAIRDWVAYERTRSTGGWPGNDPGAGALEPTAAEIDSGAYRVMDLAAVIWAAVGNEEERAEKAGGWPHVAAFLAGVNRQLCKTHTN